MRQGSANTTLLAPKGNAKLGRLPKQGTILRHYYDQFVNNPGKVIHFNTSEGTKNNVLRQLCDYYGLVIKKTSRREERVLVGRYVGAEYVEYECGEKTY